MQIRRLKRGRAGSVGRQAWALMAQVVVGLALLLVAGACAAAGSGDKQEPAKDVTSVAQQPTPTPSEVKLFCYVETLTADRPSVYGYLAPRGCQPSGVFKRGERMVWRFQVMDISAGKLVTPEEAAKVEVVLPYLGPMAAEYKQRGEGRVPDAPWTWDFCWDVPPDYPLGTMDYAISVTLKDGRTGQWKPPALVDPSRGVDSRPQIIE